MPPHGPRLVELDGKTVEVQPTTCVFCGERFPTRSSMFRHLERPSETCKAPRQDRGEKVFLVVGYDCCLMRGGGEGGGGDGGETLPVTPTTSTRPVGGQNAATSVQKAMGIDVESAGGGDGGEDSSQDCCVRPGGFSQASSVGSRTCPLLAQEAEVSAT